MGVGSKMLRCSLKVLAAGAAMAALHCGGKTTIFLGTAPGEATASEAGTKGDADAPHESGLLGVGGFGGSIGPVECQAGTTTSVSGTVYDPAGKVPLYNVIVYALNAGEDPVQITDGVSCGKCDSTVSAQAATLTDEGGRFVLQDVAPGINVPIVMQIGKWRRTISIPKVVACQDNPANRTDTRLPRNQKEGHIPRIAVTTGHADALECLLLKIGIDPTEFTTDSADGRVHMFVGCPNGGSNYGTNQFSPELGGDKFAAATTLYDPAKLMNYDMIVMSCEGTQCGSDKKDHRADIQDYANRGGRLFLDHTHFYWLRSGITPWPDTADYVGADKLDLPFTFTSQIDTEFPKGKSFANWLGKIGTSTPGTITILGGQFSVRATVPPLTQEWIHTDKNPNDVSGLAVEYMTMNTPVDIARSDPDNQCGRVVYTDLHVVTDSLNPRDISDTANPFPKGCTSKDLLDQELALEFMFFDLSSCVLKEDKAPTPPAAIIK